MHILFLRENVRTQMGFVTENDVPDGYSDNKTYLRIVGVVGFNRTEDIKSPIYYIRYLKFRTFNSQGGKVLRHHPKLQAILEEEYE